MVEIITVPFGHHASALKSWKPEPEEIVYEHFYRSGKSTWKSSALFCPQCSKIREKDTKMVDSKTNGM